MAENGEAVRKGWKNLGNGEKWGEIGEKWENGEEVGKSVRNCGKTEKNGEKRWKKPGETANKDKNGENWEQMVKKG